jgi:M6 family metalloprotease-like protein
MARDRLLSFCVLAVLLLTSFIEANILYAGPACPKPFTIQQPDGSEFTAYAKGDEYTNWIETEDGYPIIINKDSGNWEYAEIAPLIGLKPAGKIVGKDAPVGVNKISAKDLRSFRSGQNATAGSSAQGSAPASAGAPQQAPLNIVGTRKLVVILVNFANRPLNYTEPDWASRVFTGTNSVKTYYDEVSYEQLTIAPAEETNGIPNNGIISVTLISNHPNPGGAFGAANQQLTKNAIIAADPYINFASFDTDGNNSITTNELNIMVIAAGFEESYTPSGTPSLWCHKWVIDSSISPTLTAPIVDGKTVGAYPGGYTQLGELHGSQVSNHQATIGTMVHELAHDLGTATVYMGLPDLYDADGAIGGDSDGAGDWDAMASGSWNGSPSGNTPPHFSAWCKWYLGWLTPTEITVQTASVLFPRVETSSDTDRGVKQIHPNPNGPEIGGTGEYFLIENRQKIGYDAALPGAGLLIWHIDETQSDNKTPARKLVDLEEADGLNELDTAGGDQGDTGDPYPTGALNKRVFDNNSNPNSKFYSGLDSSLVISNISNSAATMSADILSPFDEPPILTSPGDWSIDVTQLLSFTLYAFDPNSDPITYTMAATPTGATLDSVTGIFNWIPGYTQEGIYDVMFTANSTILSDSKPVRITVSQTVPSSPTGLSAVVISTFASRLDWTDTSPNEEGFKIERSYDNSLFTQIDTVGVDITSYLDNGLSLRNNYYYRIRAYNSAGDSDYSDTFFIQAQQTTTGSSGSDKKKKKSKCGLLGIEAVVTILVMRAMRKRKK